MRRTTSRGKAFAWGKNPSRTLPVRHVQADHHQSKTHETRMAGLPRCRHIPLRNDHGGAGATVRFNSRRSRAFAGIPARRVVFRAHSSTPELNGRNSRIAFLIRIIAEIAVLQHLPSHNEGRHAPPIWQGTGTESHPYALAISGIRS